MAATWTRLKIKEVAQRNDTGPPDQMQLIHGERYMKKVFIANSFMGENDLQAVGLWECRFSQR